MLKGFFDNIGNTRKSVIHTRGIPPKMADRSKIEIPAKKPIEMILEKSVEIQKPDPRIVEFTDAKIKGIKSRGVDYSQGQDDCPICGSVINYTWSVADGFTVFECTGKDCLPYPTGGAMKRRLNGEPKLMAERYRKGK